MFETIYWSQNHLSCPFDDFIKAKKGLYCVFTSFFVAAKSFPSLCRSLHLFMSLSGRNSFLKRIWDIRLHFEDVLFYVHLWMFFKHILHGDKMNVSHKWYLIFSMEVFCIDYLKLVFCVAGHVSNQHDTCLWQLINSGKPGKEAQEMLEVNLVF